jgi:hypothetical protein
MAQVLQTIALSALVLGACDNVEVKEVPSGVAGAIESDAQIPTEDFFDSVVPATDQPTAAIDEEDLGSRAAGVQLARMTISEATSLQPLNGTWEKDMQGILQVARNTRGRDETLLDSLKQLSPHVGMLRPYTDERQPWTSSLPALGDGPPALWVECLGWETVRGRKRAVPAGCHGVWELGAKSWVMVRSYAIALVRMSRPVTSVQGRPTTWGGVMDLVTLLKDRPNMCWLESGPTTNYFFGLRTDSANKCKDIPVELIQESRLVSAEIVMRGVRQRIQER